MTFFLNPTSPIRQQARGGAEGVRGQKAAVGEQGEGILFPNLLKICLRVAVLKLDLGAELYDLVGGQPEIARR